MSMHVCTCVSAREQKDLESLSEMTTLNSQVIDDMIPEDCVLKS